MLCVAAVNWKKRILIVMGSSRMPRFPGVDINKLIECIITWVERFMHGDRVSALTRDTKNFYQPSDGHVTAEGAIWSSVCFFLQCRAVQEWTSILNLGPHSFYFNIIIKKILHVNEQVFLLSELLEL